MLSQFLACYPFLIITFLNFHLGLSDGFCDCFPCFFVQLHFLLSFFFVILLFIVSCVTIIAHHAILVIVMLRCWVPSTGSPIFVTYLGNGSEFFI